MPTTESALATLRPDLGASFMEFELEANRRGFIAQKVLPLVEVAKQAGTFGKITIEQLLKTGTTRRTPGAGYNRGDWSFDDATFSCEEHGWEEPVDDREAKMYADYFDAEQISTLRAYNNVLLNMEARVSAAIFNATTWTSYTTGITTEWSTVATATPLADIRAAKLAVFNQCGMWPNTVIMDREVFNNCIACADVVSLIKYSGLIDPRAGAITPQALAQAFDVDQVLVAGGAKDTALEGQAASIASLWDDEYVMVCKTATTDDIREPCIGRIFHWAEDGSSIGGTVETYREEQRRSDIVRVRNDVDEVVLYVECGHLLSNATA
jgi:hypothetical protein